VQAESCAGVNFKEKHMNFIKTEVILSVCYDEAYLNRIALENELEKLRSYYLS
jgi:hypothetical protein